jgi:hypothetical protein
MGKLMSIAQDAVDLMGGHCFGWKAFKPRMVTFKVKGRLNHSETLRGKSGGRAPSLHIIP